MIEGSELLAALRKALSRSRVVILTGPRQCGKTTLARHILSETSVNYFDLEDPADLNRLAEPMIALGQLKSLVVIDEIQRRPSEQSRPIPDPGKRRRGSSAPDVGKPCRQG